MSSFFQSVTSGSPAAGAAGALTGVKSIFTDISTHFKNYWWVYLIIVILIGLGVGLYLYFSRAPKGSPAANDKMSEELAAAAAAKSTNEEAAPVTESLPVAAAGDSTTNTGKKRSKKGSNRKGARREGFQVQTEGRTPGTIASSDKTLINSQVMSIKDVGFIGPYPKGKYEEDNATAKVLKAGFRFLTLQVDYLDTIKDAKLFERPKLPTLLIRSSTKSLLSGNSGSIEAVAAAIANVGFRPEVPNNVQPIILYIQVNSAPDPVKAPEQYLEFLSEIAGQLNPIAPVHLGLSSSGNYTRQKLENELLVTPLSTFNGQVIIMSNVDTTLFRNRAYKSYPPAQDLDFWVNMRVYLQDAADVFGVSSMPPKSVTPAAVVVDLNRVLGLTGTLVQTFAANAKDTFTIAMPDRTTNPTPAEFNTALDNYGINAIPIDIFSDLPENVMQMASEYDNMSYFPKPAAQRATNAV